MKHFILTTCMVSTLLISTLAHSEAEFSSELIFPLQEKHVHGSTLAEMHNGEIVAAWFHGSGERKSNDVQVLGARLDQDDTEWSNIFPMADTPDLPDCNPVLYTDSDNRLFLFWIAVQGNRWEYSILKYKRADRMSVSGPPNWNWQDNIILKPGEQFSKQINDGLLEVGLRDGMWGEYALPYRRQLTEAAKDSHKRQMGWMGRAQAITLPSGRILLPLYSDGFNVSLCAISDDQGDTWRASGPMVGLAPIQPTLTRGKDGTLYAWCRDSGGAPNRVMLSISKDDGDTWSVTHDTELLNPGSSLAAVTIKDGRWLMLLNDTERGRHQLLLMLSDDDGKTWSHQRYLDKAEMGSGGSYEYPTIMQARNGKIHVSYTYKEKVGNKQLKSIKHAAFDVDWVKEN